ncbi:hypothetical protein ELQ18_07785 [Neisseria meningitidis]|nr:hypothetical protein [Neisseria meningitidis]
MPSESGAGETTAKSTSEQGYSLPLPKHLPLKLPLPKHLPLKLLLPKLQNKHFPLAKKQDTFSILLF